MLKSIENAAGREGNLKMNEKRVRFGRRQAGAGRQREIRAQGSAAGPNPPEANGALQQAAGAVWVLAGVVELLAGLRVAARLFAYRPQTALGEWLLSASGLLVRPFRFLVQDLPVDGAVLDVAGLIAIPAYALLAWCLVRLLSGRFEQPGSDRPNPYNPDEWWLPR